MAHVSGSGFGNVGSYSKIGTWTFCAAARSRAAVQATAQATAIAAAMMCVLIARNVSAYYLSTERTEKANRRDRKGAEGRREGGCVGWAPAFGCLRPAIGVESRPDRKHSPDP